MQIKNNSTHTQTNIMNLVDLLGYFGAFLSAITFMPQVWLAWKSILTGCALHTLMHEIQHLRPSLLRLATRITQTPVIAAAHVVNSITPDIYIMEINHESQATQEVINTVAPISIVDLKRYFANKDLTYVINYAGSTLKGSTLLTYLSNLDLPCDVSGFDSQTEVEELLRAYFESPFIVHVPALEKLAIAVVFEYKGLIEPSAFASFIAENRAIISHWVNVLDSCMVYNLFIINSQEIKDMAHAIITAQTAEISQMKEWQKTWYNVQ